MKKSYWQLDKKGKGLFFTMMMGVVLVLNGCGNEQGARVNKENAQEQELQAKEGGQLQSPVQLEELPKHLMDGKYKEIYPQLSSELQAIVSLEDFGSMVEEFTAGVKVWTSNSDMHLNGAHLMNWIDDSGKRGIFAAADESHTIVGLQLAPLESHPETDQQLTEASYGLPFRGEWLVYWGGEDVLNNYHYAVESQRYAIDVIQAKDGFSYQGDAALNESYYAFGQEIVAAGDGTVVAAENLIADNEPVGTMNEKEPMGNYVIIDHGNGEYSYYAHLKKDSVEVAVGDVVTKGQLLGLCGNSGNSSEAHLHFQVSDGTDLFKSKALNVRWDEGVSLVKGAVVSGK